MLYSSVSGGKSYIVILSIA